MSIIGSIRITDRVSGVLRNIRREQTQFRRDITETRRALERTWGRMRQFGRTVISPVIRVRDLATGAINRVRNRVRAAGRLVMTPLIRLRDAVSRPLGKITNGLKAVGRVFTPIIRLKDATASGLAAIGGKLKALAAGTVVPVTVAATVATTAVIGGAISQGAGLEQSIGGVETLFKDNAGIVKANADAAFRTAGLSANEYMEQVTSFSASLLSSLGGDTKKAASVADMAMVDMADNANKFGTDIGLIQNAYQGFAKQNYTMLDNLKLGYGGTQEEMQRLLDDAGKLTGVTYSMDSLADVYNAVHAIQENLGVTGTTAKEASETFSGSFASMKSAAMNLLGNMAIGGDVEGSMKQLVNTASTFLFDNAVPMVSRVISSFPTALKTGIESAVPAIKTAGAEAVAGLKDSVMGALPPGMEDTVNRLFGGIKNLGKGFLSAKPQLVSFGTALVSTFQNLGGSCIRSLSSVITTVQTALPAVLPVFQTVVTTIGNLLAQAAPVIAGLVGAIGIAVTALAPVFQTIFTAIGEKVSTVIGIVSSKMDFIKNVIATAAPAIGTVLTTAWSIISPVLDILITTFEMVLDVTEAVWPTVQSTIEQVWEVLEPIFSSIGKGADMLAGAWTKVKGLITGDSGAGSTGGNGNEPGKNAGGDNHWRGGPTWVGEKGPELIELPRGTRILPHKESVAWARQRDNILPFPGTAPTSRRQTQPAPLPGNTGMGRSVVIQINKIADNVTVRSESDVDEIAERTAKKIIEELDNTA